ncbi:MAG TPA: hypothetical protein VGT24_00055 [Candidatus Acidoferrales bacterium]|nr:hypothetical protein [Candidatus Acidoferrales bacterium]
MRNVLAPDHDSCVPNNLFSTLVKNASPVALPLFAMAELAKQSTSTDLNHDGRFTHRSAPSSIFSVAGKCKAADSLIAGARLPTRAAEPTTQLRSVPFCGTAISRGASRSTHRHVARWAPLLLARLALALVLRAASIWE